MHHRRTILIASLLALIPPRAAPAQTPSPTTLSGTVVNAVSGSPVFRALVRLSGSGTQRALLTDSLGHFTFADVAPSPILSLTAIKPGYSMSPDSAGTLQIQLTPSELAAPVQLRLYPEAILKGDVLSPDGDPLNNIEITAFRSMLDDSGRHWTFAARTRSNTHGQFRLPVPAGDYSLQTAFRPISSSSALLPVVLPQGGASPESQSIHVRSGDQLDLDLHPPFAPLISVTAHLDRNPAEIGGLTAVLRDGTSFSVPFTVSGGSDIRLNLPPGNYVLQARHRGFGGEAVEQAGIAVAASNGTLSLQFAPVTPIPIAISVDSAALSDASSAGQTLTPPNARALGLLLQPDDPVPSFGSQQIRPTSPRYAQQSEPASFAAPPGSYRLRAATSNWYILSANYGGSDLLEHDLLVAPGAGDVPLEIVVGNQSATLSGNVLLDGKPAACWIYLIASSPTATPIIALQSGTLGAYNDPYLPPGTYSVVAFARRQSLDPADPAALNPWSSHVRTVTLQPGEKATLNLEAVPDSELQP